MATDRPLRVLFVNENLGGHTTVHLALRACLGERTDVEATFIDGPDPSRLTKIARAPIPGLARFDADLQPLRSQLSRSASLRRPIRDALASGSFDVMHVYTQNCMLGNARALRQIPTVVSTDSTGELNAYLLPYRGPSVGTSPALRLSVPFERRVLQAAHTVVANSAAVVKSLTTRYALPTDRIVNLPFGMRLPDRTQLADRAARPTSHRPVIAFLGYSLARKGGYRLLDLHQKHLVNRADLLLITRDEVPVLPGVRVLSDVKPQSAALWGALADADFLCFPSEMDQSPNAVLEAASAGLPVIAHPVGAISDMVIDGVTGLLPPAGDDVALLGAIEHLLAHRDVRLRMGIAARQHAELRFDMRDTTTTLIEHLDRAAGHRRPIAERLP